MRIIYPVDIAVIAFGVAVLIMWVFLFVRGYGQEDLFEGLPAEDYPLKGMYFVGYALLEWMQKDYKSAKDRTLRRQLAVLYEEKFADFYLRAVYCKQTTMCLTVLALAAPLYCFAEGSLLVFLLVIAGAGVTFYYYGTTTASKVKKQGEEMLLAFPDVTSKLALLINSGMILREAWERVAESGEGILYREMRQSVVNMRNGWSETDALFAFGQRCTIPEIKKFTSTLIQSASKGNQELAASLSRQSKEVWELKRQNVRRQGELANNKLMLPICLTFIGILIMVIVPIFTNLGA